MGDYQHSLYMLLSLAISFLGPFYVLEEKIYEFREAERISRESCISFNREMKPYWHNMQDKIFRPPVDTSVYEGSMVQKLITARSRMDYALNKADEYALNFETISEGPKALSSTLENLARYMRHRLNHEKKSLDWNIKKTVIEHEDLRNKVNTVKRYIMQIDEMDKGFVKMEKYMERILHKCRDVELFFGNRTGILDINIEGSMMKEFEKYVNKYKETLPMFIKDLETPPPIDRYFEIREKLAVLRKQYIFKNQPRWVQKLVTASAIANDTIKANTRIHEEIHNFRLHNYEFGRNLTDEQKYKADEWIFMNSTIVSSIKKRHIRQSFVENISWSTAWKNLNTTEKMFKVHARHQITERDYPQEVDFYLDMTDKLIERYKNTELTEAMELTVLQSWLQKSAGVFHKRMDVLKDIVAVQEAKDWYDNEKKRAKWGISELAERWKYYINKIWMPKAGEFGVRIKWANSQAMDLSWLGDEKKQ